jgi:carbamoyl-phosphate synthase large subunit
MWRRLKKGSSYLAKVVDKPEVLDEMETIASELEVVGSINLQCRLTKDGPVVFEINPRFSGTSAARAVAGMNGVDISIRHLLFGEHPARSKKRPITMIRHLAEIYVSEDDILATEKCGLTETRGEVYGYF